MTNNSTRRYDLDWLRVLAIMIVFLYHSTRFFNFYDWHLKNSSTYLWVECWNIFTVKWMMPLFFIISGASLFYALDKGGGFRNFFKDKVLRLLIPVVLGSVTFSIFQMYLEKSTHGHFGGTFLQYIPHYFSGLFLSIGGSGNFAFHGMHLWYLLFLFIFSLLCYGLFSRLKKGEQKFLKTMTALLAVPGLIYLLLPVPMLIIKAAVPPAIANAGSGGWGFLYYLWFLIAGFIIISDESLQASIKKLRWLSLLLGIILSALIILQYVHIIVAFKPGIFQFMVESSVTFVNTWAWVLTILGFGMKHLTGDRPFLRYANEAVLPFYILHQTVLLFFGYFIITLAVDDFFKWALIYLISFITIMALYELLIRRFDILRLLFGMKTVHRPYAFMNSGIVLAVICCIPVLLTAFAALNREGKDAPGTQTVPAAEMNRDVLLTYTAITRISKNGVRIIDDAEASAGKAIEFTSGSRDKAADKPAVFIEMEFTAPRGMYYIWLRGKSDRDDASTDSVWIQFDNEIGTYMNARRAGNWLEVHPAGTYGWTSDAKSMRYATLKRDGKHRLRIQPRQVPHRIDQVWLSRWNTKLPCPGKPARPKQ